MERTLVIIKPDAVERGLIGKIIARFEEKGLKVLAMKMVHLTKAEAEGFYQVHRGRPFFESLTRFMSSSPIVPMVLEGPEAITRVRELMGATNPANAAEGTIRKDFALDVEKNSVHGSDSPNSAAIEIPYFFSSLELHSYQRSNP
ncbi:MAG TPA: nucleoside-diphosphate kinase [Candidatus Limnocylindrales bacterium]|nr:nucleoside-diphosphate kinase [Candidatus Limnocylindrales bacterium]